MSSERLREIRERLEGAKEGPWVYQKWPDDIDDCGRFVSGDVVVCDFGNNTAYYPTAGDAPFKPNRDLIENAHSDIWWLIERVERCESALESVMSSKTHYDAFSTAYDALMDPRKEEFLRAASDDGGSNG